jgi:transglutaminase-like putative cysteine protease
MNKLIKIIVFFTCVHIFGQDFEFNKISNEELLEKFHPKDSTAVAATLWEDGNLKFRYSYGYEYVLEVTRRVKIYRKEGFDYGTITIPFYVGGNVSDKEKVIGLKAYVYNIEDGKVQKEKLRNKDFIEEEVSEYWSQVKFTFPNLSPGSVIEYTYTKYSQYYTELPRWNFQDEIPVNYSHYKLTIPEMFTYKEQQRGFHFIEREIKNVSTLMTIISKKGRKEDRRDSKEYEYTARNVPKLKDEPYVNNVENFMTSIKHVLSYSRFGYGEVNEFSTTWPEIAKSLHENDNFGKQLDKTKYYEDDLQPIIQASDNEENLVSNIFSFVKNNIKWNNYNSIYTSGRLKEVYKEKTGNIADINLMLTSMLRYAGLQANPVLISTVDNGIPSNFVSRKDYNYVISAVNLNNNLFLLDASSPYSAPNILPLRCLNWFGQMIKPDNTAQQISLQPQEKSKDNFFLNLKLKEDGSVVGEMRRQYTNHLGHIYRVRYTEVDEEKYIEEKENDYEIEILEYGNENINKLTDAVIETMSFKKENAADVINENIYFSPMLFLATDENPFKEDQIERKLPIDFTFPRSSRYIINLEIPEGYAVDYLPEPTAVALPQQKAMFRYNIKKDNSGVVQIVVTEDINTAILPAEFYVPLKDYFSQIVSKETDKIVLKKL